jgi:hypothetical protein
MGTCDPTMFLKKEGKVLERQRRRKHKFKIVELIQKVKGKKYSCYQNTPKIKEYCDENQIQAYENLVRIVPGCKGKQSDCCKAFWNGGG